MDNDKLDSIIMKALTERLKYDLQEVRPIIYADNMVFEYNQKGDMIRPVNSALWFKVSDEYALYTDYLKTRCNTLYKRYVEDDEAFLITGAHFSDGYVTIDLDELRQNIAENPKLCKELKQNIILNGYKFYEFISEIYLRSSILFENAVDHFKDEPYFDI